MALIGFIGLGRMGRPMASNLCRKGFELVVHDVNRAAVADLQKLGARVAGSSREVAEAGEIILTMLPNSEIVREVVHDILPVVRKGVNPRPAFTQQLGLQP